METEKVLFNATVVFLVRNGKVLLARKTKKIGKGKWNGYGGGVEPGEDVRSAAVRELCEETGGVRVQELDLEQIALVHFHNTKSDGTKFTCSVHMFVAHTWRGEVQSTPEMSTPTWFGIDELPLEEMMPADRDWLPRALAGEKLVAHAYLGPYQQKRLAPTSIKIVSTFETR